MCVHDMFLHSVRLMHDQHALQSHAVYSADIGINTASSCDGPTFFVPELVAGGTSISLT